MADGFRNSAGQDASTLYDPDIIGDGYNATFLTRSDGTTLRYAAAKYGTPGPVLGFRDSSGNDVGPRWAAKGTAVYLIPTPSYNNQLIEVTGTGTLSCHISINPDGTWTSSDPSIPGGYWYGASSTPGIGSNYQLLATPGSHAGTVTNPASSYTTITGTLTIQFTSSATTSVAVQLQIREVGASSAGSNATVTLATTNDG